METVHNASSTNSDFKHFCTCTVVSQLWQCQIHQNGHILILCAKQQYSSDESKRETWVDAKIHKWGLYKIFKPVNENLEEVGHHGALSMGNLSHNKIDASIWVYEDELRHVYNTILVPEWMTWFMHTIYRHVGIDYNISAYNTFYQRTSSAYQMPSLQSKWSHKGKVTHPPKNRITWTMVYHHAKATGTDTYRMTFFATGMRLPIQNINDFLDLQLLHMMIWWSSNT